MEGQCRIMTLVLYIQRRRRQQQERTRKRKINKYKIKNDGQDDKNTDFAIFIFQLYGTYYFVSNYFILSVLMCLFDVLLWLGCL